MNVTTLLSLHLWEVLPLRLPARGNKMNFGNARGGLISETGKPFSQGRIFLCVFRPPQGDDGKPQEENRKANAMTQMKEKRRNKGSGHILKGRNCFYLQYRDLDHRRKCITLTDASGKKISEERAAQAAAKRFLERLHKLDEIETREDYLEKKAKLKKLKARLTITLDDAFDLHLQKPHTRIAGSQVLHVARRYWGDFVSFLKEKYHLHTLDEVERGHAEAYVAYIRNNGRWKRTITYDRERCPHRRKFKEYECGGFLSNNTLNRYQSTCKAVFSFLSPDLGYNIEENPFYYIKPLKNESEDREIFTEEELRRIFETPPPMLRGLFTIGICTGLRLGDVATLKWSEIGNYKADGTGAERFFGQEIARLTRKTKTWVHVPIEQELAAFLDTQSLLSGMDEYILPEAAVLYFEHRNVLTNRIHSYLHSLGIVTQREVPGRKRKQSVKDFHSLRHCFCYYAGLRGVPLPVVQSIVGHLNDAMTRHYQSHADRKARMEGIARMRGLISGESPGAGPVRLDDLLRQRIVDFARNAGKMEVLQLNVLIDKLNEKCNLSGIIQGAVQEEKEVKQLTMRN